MAWSVCPYSDDVWMFASGNTESGQRPDSQLDLQPLESDAPCSTATSYHERFKGAASDPLWIGICDGTSHIRVMGDCDRVAYDTVREKVIDNLGSPPTAVRSDTGRLSGISSIKAMLGCVSFLN